MEAKTPGNETSDEVSSPIIEGKLVMTGFIIVYGLIFLLGSIGNVMVLFAVIGNKQMHTVANMLISNLATADLVMAVTCVPVTPAMTFMKRWLLGEVMCHIIPMTSAVSVYVNTLTGIIIAVDRYIVIVHPLTQKKLALRSTIVLIIAVWVFGVLFSLPLGVVQRLLRSDSGDDFCVEIWPDSKQIDTGNSSASVSTNLPSALKTSFDISSFCLQWVIPSLMITFCYASVSVKLTQRLRDRARFTTRKDAKREIIEVSRNRRMNRMFTLVIASHALCWIPLNLFNLVDNPLDLAQVFGSYYMFVFMMAHVIAMSSVIYNPILYAWFNEKFRQEFTKMCACTLQMCKKTTAAVTNVRSASDDSANKAEEKNGGNQSTVPLIRVTHPETEEGEKNSTTETDGKVAT